MLQFVFTVVMSIILMNVTETLLMDLYDEAQKNARADRCFKQVSQHLEQY